MNITNKGRDAHRFRPLKERKVKVARTTDPQSGCALLFNGKSTIREEDRSESGVSGEQSDDSLSVSVKEETSSGADDDEELRLELEAIKREKREKAKADAAEARATDNMNVMQKVKMLPTENRDDWTADAVFQVRHSEVVESHVNDTLRSKFHRRFLDRHIA